MSQMINTKSAGVVSGIKGYLIKEEIPMLNMK